MLSGAIMYSDVYRICMFIRTLILHTNVCRSIKLGSCNASPRSSFCKDKNNLSMAASRRSVQATSSPESIRNLFRLDDNRPTQQPQRNSSSLFLCDTQLAEVASTEHTPLNRIQTRKMSSHPTNVTQDPASLS